MDANKENETAAQYASRLAKLKAKLATTKRQRDQFRA
jgi:hypothetical protein